VLPPSKEPPLKEGLAFAVRQRIGESVSGDGVLVQRCGSVTWLVVVDGLGHGPPAHEVVIRTGALTAGLSAELSTESVMGLLHDALRGTRGAAAMVFRVHEGAIEGCAVGNIDVRTIGARIPVVSRSGVVGARLPALRAFHSNAVRGMRAFVFSDGISRRAPFDDLARLGPQAACDALLDGHRHDHDDSSVAALYFD